MGTRNLVLINSLGIVPSFYKRVNTAKGEILHFVGCYQLPVWVTLRKLKPRSCSLTTFIWPSGLQT